MRFISEVVCLVSMCLVSSATDDVICSIIFLSIDCVAAIVVDGSLPVFPVRHLP